MLFKISTRNTLDAVNNPSTDPSSSDEAAGGKGSSQLDAQSLSTKVSGKQYSYRFIVCYLKLAHVTL